MAEKDTFEKAIVKIEALKEKLKQHERSVYSEELKAFHTGVETAFCEAIAILREEKKRGNQNMNANKNIMDLTEGEQAEVRRMKKKGFTAAEITYRLMDARRVGLWNCLSVEVQNLLTEKAEQ